MATASSGLISGSVKWTGLATGTDFKSVVESLVAIESRTITRQQTWQSQWQAKLESINNLDVRLGSLKMNAQDYDTRDELLARSATSSKEEVATITNTSTAATGVYSVEVGENVVEKIGSKTYKDTEAIGGGVLKNADGHLLDINNDLIGNSQPDDANLIAFIEEKTGQTGVTYDTGSQEYRLSDNSAVALYKPGSVPPEIVRYDGLTENGQLAVAIDTNNSMGRVEFVRTDNGKVLPTAETAPTALVNPPMTFTMGGKTLTLTYDPSATGGDIGVYSPSFTMADLVDSINNTVADSAYDGPALSAELVFDKTRSDGDYSRLVITGGEGGKSNHITVSDPTDLCLDRNSVDAPVTTSWLGCNVDPLVDPSSNYTGHVNKTITVVATKYKENAVLGENDIQFNWADTEGNSGEFIIRAADWDSVNDCLKEPIELLQGVKISFAGKSGTNYMQMDQAFTIDCQAPVMQKATDIGLAQTDKWVHQGVSDLTSPINSGGTGVFAYSYAGREYSVSFGELTLQGLVDRINNDSSNPGVIASVLNDGMGTATSYKLVLTGAREGAENGIRVLDSTKLSNMNTDPDSWTHAREASNSMCRIDGYPNDGVSWIQRPTNEVGDVLSGVVITLQGPGESIITVQNNVTEMASRIKQLVESVNFCKSYIKEQTKFSGAKLTSKYNEQTQMFERVNESGEDANGNASSAASGIMIGNYGFQISQSTIDQLMTKEIFTRDEYIKAIDPGGTKQALYPKTVADEERDGPSQEGLYREYLDKHGLVYTRLSDIGIASDPSNQGQYIVEESKLTEALSKNPEAVIKLFTFKPGDDEMSQFVKYDDEDPRVRIGGFAVNMGYAMGDLTRTADVIDSKTGETTERAKGITKVLAENYAGIISGIDEKIAREERRISMVRTRLEEKFNRLEVLLASLENQSTSVQAQIDKLNGDSG